MPLRRRTLRAALAIALPLTGLGACGASGSRAPAATGAPLAAADQAQDRATMLRLMDESRDAWNRGDLPGHVAMYADSATMMSAQGPRGGRDVIRSMLERSFWEGGRPKARLDFSDLVVTPLGRDHAMMTGAFLLTYPDGRTTNGRYTLVWGRGADGQWRVMHDHSG